MNPDLPRFSFGDNAELADQLLQLVLTGQKTATCSAATDYGRDKPIPRVGDRFVVTNGAGADACVIEITSVFFARFDDVKEEFARAEGEGDLSLKYWRQSHCSYFTRQGFFSPDMILVCERFKLIETL
jgi:uncharacterized protein YhfF